MNHLAPPEMPDEANVAQIADDTEAPRQEVRELLQEETADLLATSRVKKYVGLLASKHVKQKLKERKVFEGWHSRRII